MNKKMLSFCHFAVIFQSVVSIALLSRFYEYTVFSELTIYGFGSITEDYPRYFQALNGLLGMNAISILVTLFGIYITAKPEKKSIYAFMAL